MKKSTPATIATPKQPAASKASLASKNLGTYFHDHLAGAMGALELLGHLIEHTQASGRRAKLASLRNEITKDHDVLVKIAQGLDLQESPMKKALGWIGEKAARLKFALSKDNPGSVGLVQAMEVLSLGIAGKRGLWDALAATQPPGMAKIKINLSKLTARADKQRAMVESWRIEAAREAFL